MNTHVALRKLQIKNSLTIISKTSKCNAPRLNFKYSKFAGYFENLLDHDILILVSGILDCQMHFWEKCFKICHLGINHRIKLHLPE